MGNPVTEESFELVAIHTKDVMDAAVVGEELFQNFSRKERFLREAHLLQILYKKPNYLHSSLKARKSFQKTKAIVEILENDCALFFRIVHSLSKVTMAI